MNAVLVNSYFKPKEGFSNYWTWLAKATIENTHDLYFDVKEVMIEGKQVNSKIRQLCTGKVMGTYHIKWKEIVESFREDFGIPEPKEHFISKLDKEGKIQEVDSI